VNLAPTRLRVDARDSQPGTADRHVLIAITNQPRLSWIVPLERNGQCQLAFEIQLSGADLELSSELTVHVFGGSSPWTTIMTPLEVNSRYRWAVRVQDENEGWGPWSEPSEFETGPFSFADWTASWVTAPSLAAVARTFSLPGPVKRARLHLTAQGLVRAAINNTPVNSTSSDPSRTDFTRALYRTYDVTDLLVAGDNGLELTLARGDWHRTGQYPRVLAEIVLQLQDGSRIAVGTGSDMKTYSSLVAEEEPFYLERQDPTASRTALPNALVLSAAEVPAVAAVPPRDVTPDPSPPLRVTSELECVEILRIGEERVFAAPTNIAGRSRIAVVGALPRGTVIRVTHGELLDDAGCVNTTNLSLPFDHGRVRQVVEYVATGDTSETFEAWFCFHGFAFVQVSGLPDDSVVTVRALLLHTDLASVSLLSTDDPIIETLIARARRTLLNNVHGIPEDCPTREQAGWTGDTASVTEFEFSSFDMQAFFQKWLGDLVSSQLANGAIPAIAPDLRPEKVPSDPVWGAALQRVLMGHWLHYGDKRVVQDNLPALRRWVDFQLTCRDEDGVIGHAPISYGHDWLALDQTPPRLHHTSATLESLGILGDLERMLGNVEEAETRLAQRDGLSSAASRRFVDPGTPSIGNGSEGSLAVAVTAGFLDDQRSRYAVGALEDDIRRRGNRVSTGFATTRAVIRALAENNRSQVIFDSLRQRAEPGIGAMLDHGPGTMWENWWIDPTNTGTGSLDHIGLGGPFAGWAEQRLAGIRPTGAGYSTFEAAPQFVEGVNDLSYETVTVRGTIALRYTRVGAHVRLNLEVPVGAAARVLLPGAPPVTVYSGRHEFECLWFAVQNQEASTVSNWRPPARMSVSTDVSSDNVSLWPSTRSKICCEDGTFEVLPDGLNCMPVPHAQLWGPVGVVTGRFAGVDPTARIDFTETVDLTNCAFVFAHLDACIENESEPRQMVLTVAAEDGSRVSRSGRFWPAGWNRIAVDVDEWPGRSRVVSIDVTVDFAPALDRHLPSVFRLAMVGASSSRRTW
jgi:alpha-L-rhamnosidase